AFVALTAGFVRLFTAQKCNRLVAQVDQVLGNAVGGGAVVNKDAGGFIVGRLGAGENAYKFNFALVQGVEYLGGFGHGRREHQAAHPAAIHHAQNFVNQVVGLGITGVNHQLIALAATLAQNPLLHLDHIVAVGVVVNKAN